MNDGIREHSAIEAEICVIGGGPAGCVIARHLAKLGHKTLLIHRVPEPTSLRPESLPPSIVPILESLDLSSALDAAIYCREKSALVRWRSAQIQRRVSVPPSFLIERGCFDRQLRVEAAGMGAQVIAPANAWSPRRRASGGWIIPAITPRGPVTIAAELLVDARGKRRGGSFNNVRTISLSAAWRGANGAYEQTRIEAGTDEWFWGCPLPDGLYSATVFLDAICAAGLNGRRRLALYRRMLSGSKLLKDLLEGEIVGPLSVRDATSRIALDLIERDLIRVGEAAFSMDPLSSQGVQRAILSAVQGAAAVHTICISHDPLPAMTFFRKCQQQAARQANHHATQLYRDVSDERSRFWTVRSRAADAAATTLQRSDVSAMLPAYVKLSDQLKVVDVPVLDGAIIGSTAALHHPHLDDPVAYLGGIALAPLTAQIAEIPATEELLKRWTCRMPPETAVYIFRWMCAVNILVPDGKASAHKNRVPTLPK